MADQVLMRVGNTRPKLDVTLTDDDGTPVDLTGATVQVVVLDYLGTELWRNAAQVDPDPTTGHLTYAWRPQDVATAGNYQLSFHVQFDTGDTTDFPASGPLEFLLAEPGTADVDPYVIGIDRIARRIGITDLTDEIREVLEDMVSDVQADVEGYLGRPVVPIRVTEDTRPNPGEPVGWDLRIDPVVRIISAEQTPTGSYLVQYVAGITDRIAQRAIQRYVSGAVTEEFRAHPVYGRAYRAIRTLSSNGRSITYDEPAAAMRRGSAQLPAYPQPGSMPSIETLARWRRRGVFSRPRYVGMDAQGADAWPYSSGTYSIGGDADGVGGLFVGDARTGEVWPG